MLHVWSHSTRTLHFQILFPVLLLFVLIFLVIQAELEHHPHINYMLDMGVCL